MHEFNLLQIICSCSKHCINQRRRLQSWTCSQSLCCIVLPLMKSLKGKEQEIHSDFIVCSEQFFLLRNNTGLPKMTNNHHHLLSISSVPGTIAQGSFYTLLYFILIPRLLGFCYPHSTEEETETKRLREMKKVPPIVISWEEQSCRRTTSIWFPDLYS